LEKGEQNSKRKLIKDHQGSIKMVHAERRSLRSSLRLSLFPINEKDRSEEPEALRRGKKRSRSFTHVFTWKLPSGSHRVHAQKPRRVRRAKALPRRYLAVSVAVSAHCNCSASVGRPPLPGTSTHSTKSYYLILKNENPTRKLEAAKDCVAGARAHDVWVL